MMKRGVFLLILLLLCLCMALAQPPPPDTPGTPSGGDDSSSKDNTSDSDNQTQEQIVTQDTKQDSQDKGQTGQTDTSKEAENQQTQTSEESDGGLILWLSVGLIAIIILVAIYYLLTHRQSEFEITEEHRQFLKKCRRNDMSKGHVAQMLSKNGYSEDAIDAMLDEY